MKQGIDRFFKLILLFLFSGIIQMQAVHVEKMPVSLNQPDQTTLDCFVSGDEYFRRIHDADNFTIVQGADGFYYYALLQNDILVASTYRVGTVNPATVGLLPGLAVSVQKYDSIRKQTVAAIPARIKRVIGSTQSTGVIANIVVYVRFKGEAEFTKTRKDFSLMLDNPSATATSVNGYYNEISYGKQSIQSFQYPVCDSTISLSYEDIYQRGYYQPYNATTNTIGYNGDNGSREQALVARALNTISSQLPTNMVVDNDGDGYVDNVTIVVRGNADAWGNLLWPHQWTLYLASASLRGKSVGRYILITENMYTQVTLCHEMFHVIGAPDLYHYTGNGITPVGAWDLMENGSGHPLAYTKWKYSGYRWITSIPEITSSGTYSLKALTNATKNCYKIKSPYSSSEYFTLEYRRLSGLYEKNLPGMGMIITRINTYASGNGNGPPDEIYVMRPQGSVFSTGDLSKAFFSNYALRSSFNQTTNPRPFLSDGSDAGIDISNILLKGDSMVFTVNFSTALNQKTGWIVTTDSYENSSAYSPGSYVIDGDLSTIWHTPWSSSVTAFPHWLQVNFGKQLSIRGFKYLPRQDMENGRIKDYEFYTSNDLTTWNKVASGTFANSATPKTITFAETNCRYVKLVGKNEVNGKNFASMAEFDLVVTPATLSRKKWTVHSVSSYETAFPASLAFDSLASTYWKSQTTATAATYPHELAINMNDTCCLEGATFLPRQDGTTDGTVARFEFYTSLNGIDWKLVSSGQWVGNTGEKQIIFPKTVCRYIKLKALSEMSGKSMITLSEISVLGVSSADIVAPDKPENLTALRPASTNMATLSWDKNVSDKSLLNYQIYVDGVLTSTVYTNSFSLTVDSLKDYRFQVVAVDGSGNISDPAQASLYAYTDNAEIHDRDQFLVASSAGKIVVSSAAAFAEMEVFNQLGQLIVSKGISTGKTSVTVKSGVYLIRFRSIGGEYVTHKVIVH